MNKWAIISGLNPYKGSLHYQTTDKALELVDNAVTPIDFGFALHALQDSYSHWQKLYGDIPATETQIFEKHAENQVYWRRVCELNPDCSANIDYFDPQSNDIDQAMQIAVQDVIDDYVNEHRADILDFYQKYLDRLEKKRFREYIGYCN